jgi:hypothetical protein
MGLVRGLDGWVGLVGTQPLALPGLSSVANRQSPHLLRTPLPKASEGGEGGSEGGEGGEVRGGRGLSTCPSPRQAPRLAGTWMARSS